MDVQRKKGILEVCVLAVLKKGPSYGYMIIRELEQCVEISESTLYPILKRLEQSGSLRTYRQEYNGRMRKYYRLTEEGQQKIDKFLDEWDELRMMYRFVEEQNQMAVREPREETDPAVPDEAEQALAQSGNVTIQELDQSESEAEQALAQSENVTIQALEQSENVTTQGENTVNEEEAES